MMFKTTDLLVFTLSFLIVFQPIYAIDVDNTSHPRLAVFYDIRVFFEATGHYAKNLVMENVFKDSIYLEIRYKYELLIHVLNNGLFSYSYELKHYSIDSSSDVKEYFVNEINNTLREKINTVTYLVDRVVNPAVLLTFNASSNSLTWCFKDFDNFYGKPRYVVIDRDLVAFHKVEAYETRSFESYNMKYLMFVYEVLTQTPLYMYYHEYVQDERGHYRVSIRLDSEIDYYTRKTYYRVNSFNIVLENEDSASILLVSLGEINLTIEDDDNILSINVSTGEASSTVSILLLIGYGNNGFLLKESDNGLKLYSNVSIPIYLSDIRAGDTVYNISFNSEVKLLKNATFNGVPQFPLLNHQPYNSEHLVFAMLINIVVIQGCLLLGFLIAKKVGEMD